MVDAAPPVIRWEVGDRSSLSDRLAPDTERDRRRLPDRRSGGHAARDAWPSRAGVWQLPVPWDHDRDEQEIAQLPVTIASDHPQAFFAAPVDHPGHRRQGGHGSARTASSGSRPRTPARASTA